MGTLGPGVGVVVAIGFLIGAAEAETRVIGEVAALRGAATGQASDAAAATPLAVGQFLTDGETVTTGADSRLKLTLRDGSVLTLGEDATLKLDHLSLGAEATTFTLTGGYLRAAASPVRADARFEIHTPSMVAAVRGTEWIENYTAGATQLFVAKGRVMASAAGSSSADSIVLSAGDGVTFSGLMPRGRAIMAPDEATGPGGMPPAPSRRLTVGDIAHTPVSRWAPAKIRQFVEATSFDSAPNPPMMLAPSAPALRASPPTLRKPSLPGIATPPADMTTPPE